MSLYVTVLIVTFSQNTTKSEVLAKCDAPNIMFSEFWPSLCCSQICILALPQKCNSAELFAVHTHSQPSELCFVPGKKTSLKHKVETESLNVLSPRLWSLFETGLLHYLPHRLL